MISISDRFYTQTEAAHRLSVERHTLWRWIKAGKLQAQKAGGVVFIEKKAVEALRKAAQNSTAGEAA